MPLSDRDLARLQGCHPDLIAKITSLFDTLAKTGHDLFVVEGLRTTARQQGLYAIGRTVGEHGKVVTNCDGVTTKSNHQAHADGYGYAADVAFAVEKPFAASNPWNLLGAAAESLGMVWGGHFSFVDLDHVELPEATNAPRGAKGN